MSIFDKFLGRKHPPPAPAFIMSEGISGTFYYHVSWRETPYESFCGKETMATRIPMTAWGIVTHLGERYCVECKSQYIMLREDVLE